jgi:hypothetical protein
MIALIAACFFFLLRKKKKREFNDKINLVEVGASDFLDGDKLARVLVERIVDTSKVSSANTLANQISSVAHRSRLLGSRHTGRAGCARSFAHLPSKRRRKKKYDSKQTVLKRRQVPTNRFAWQAAKERKNTCTIPNKQV